MRKKKKDAVYRNPVELSSDTAVIRQHRRRGSSVQKDLIELYHAAYICVGF